jgi:hypothetical protein
MAQFIRIASRFGTIGRVNVEHILVYFPHKHSDKGNCDAAGMERCTLQTELVLAGSSMNFGTQQTAEEIDQLINPASTP